MGLLDMSVPDHLTLSGAAKKTLKLREKEYTKTEPHYLQTSYWAVTLPRFYDKDRVERKKKLAELYAQIHWGKYTLEEFMIEITKLEEEAYSQGGSDWRYASRMYTGPTR